MKKTKQKEFIALQNEWYEKLKKDGFEDIEFYNPKTGQGHNSPYMRTRNSPHARQLAQNYSPQLLQHFRLCQNYLAHGPFYSNLRSKYLKLRANGDLPAKIRSFPDFQRAQDIYYSRAESTAWQLYCDGSTLREISVELRRLHKLQKLGKPPKRWGKAAKGEPYSIFWVKKLIDRVKLDSVKFNLTDYEGIYVVDAEKDDEDGQDYIGGRF